MNQIRTEQIEFVIQSDEPTHQLIFYPAVHQFIVSTLSRILCLTGSSRVANLIATLVAPLRLTTTFVEFLPVFRAKCRVSGPWPQNCAGRRSNRLKTKMLDGSKP